MYAKSSLLVAAAVTALIVAGILSSSNITSVYAKPIDPRFCYTFTSSTGSGATCLYTMGDCKKDEARFVSEEGGTVERHCFKNA
jgi:hypothetical protein